MVPVEETNKQNFVRPRQDCPHLMTLMANDLLVETSHPLAISFSDMSVWCYECDDYIDSPNLKQIITACYVSKFGELPPNSSGIQILSDDSGATSSS
ncbi:8188_t:CDS:2 [Entrophospora sp. SA101]|nr:8188_t:CDS:2 [Entrophospora sp. SA101]